MGVDSVNAFLALFLAASFIVGVVFLGWWLLIASEGAYLGRRVVVLLYDLYAHRYDAVKNYYPEYEQMYLAEPIMEAIAPQTDPLVLDVATGTGRLPLALARHPDFQGFTIGVDLSRRMLHFGSRDVYPYSHRAVFVWCPAENLPFDDNTFDVVTSLEAMEFMNAPEAVLRELVRVLRPGGLLLITQRINTILLPGKTWTSGQVLELLERNGVEDARAQIWQVDYRKVWGRKKGESAPIGVRAITDVLRCPRCGKAMLQPEHAGEWICANCATEVPIGSDRVIELYKAK
jgi:ubiquinone/menaquinone biosynthesis C-methylase UbiE